MAVAPDGKTLYVANADNNDVMVVDISQREASREIAGFIPVGWYPTALAVSPDSGTVWVANGKGVALAAELPAAGAAEAGASGVAFDHPGKLFEGSVAVVPRPDAAALARYTRRPCKNSPYTPQTIRRAAAKSDAAFPTRPAASARSSTCSTSSRRTAPTTRSSATSRTPRAAMRATAIRRW